MRYKHWSEKAGIILLKGYAQKGIVKCRKFEKCCKVTKSGNGFSFSTETLWQTFSCLFVCLLLPNDEICKTHHLTIRNNRPSPQEKK